MAVIGYWEVDLLSYDAGKMRWRFCGGYGDVLYCSESYYTLTVSLERDVMSRGAS